MVQDKISQKSEANVVFRKLRLPCCREAKLLKSILLTLVVFLSTSSVTFGRDYSGSYIYKTNGNNIKITLSRQSGTIFKGVLKSPTGVQCAIDAEVENGILVGVCYNNQGTIAMEGNLSGSKLMLTLVELNASMQPQYSTARKIVLRKTSLPGGKKTGLSKYGSTKKNYRMHKTDNAARKYAAGTRKQNVPRATASRQEISDESWGYKFRLPKGWKYQKDHNGAIIGHDTIAGAILVLKFEALNLNEVYAQMRQGLQEANIQLSLAGPLKKVSRNTISGEYAGYSSGKQVKARSTGTLSPYGGVTYVIAITTPDKYGNKLISAADVIVQSLKFVKVDVSNLMRHFAGTWAHVSSNRTDWMTFAPNGTYSNTHEAQFSGQEGDNWGNTQNWDVYGKTQKSARWTVRGTKRKGVIIISHPNGTREELKYNVYVEKGHTYWREYLFNGYHYQKN